MFEKNVFINCPLDNKYWPLLRAMLFTIKYLGFLPRIAIESSDSSTIRLDKIQQLIQESKYSIHDISRIRAEIPMEHYRLNMAFELGIDLGAKRYGNDNLKRKKLLILEEKRHDYKIAISDIAGIDIKNHDNNASKIVKEIREWFRENTSINRPLGPTGIWNRYNDFMYDLNRKAQLEGFSEEDIEDISVVDLEEYIEEWMGKNINSAT